jgi:hypothetical protein
MLTGRAFLQDLVDRKVHDMATLSREAGKNHAYIQQFLKRQLPRELPELVRERLAVFLGCSPDQLRESGSLPFDVIPASPKLPTGASTVALGRPVEPLPLAAMRRDLPVYGTAAGSDGDGAFILHMGDVVDFVRRPPTLEGNRGAYGLYVEGESMVPAFPHGELLIVDPARPARPGDRVVMVVQQGPHEEPMAYVKELVRKSSSIVIVKQFNPPIELEFETHCVSTMHRILTMAEIHGV